MKVVVLWKVHSSADLRMGFFSFSTFQAIDSTQAERLRNSCSQSLTKGTSQYQRKGSPFHQQDILRKIQMKLTCNSLHQGELFVYHRNFVSWRKWGNKTWGKYKIYLFEMLAVLVLSQWRPRQTLQIHNMAVELHGNISSINARCLFPCSSHIIKKKLAIWRTEKCCPDISWWISFDLSGCNPERHSNKA